MGKIKFIKEFLIVQLLFGITGCSHAIKMYSGTERAPSELAIVYPHAGVTSVGIRYINDQHLKIHSSNAFVQLLPGQTKVTIVNFYNEFPYIPGQYVVKTTWTMYETPVELKAGFAYFAWTSEPNTISPREACLIELSQSELTRLYGNHAKVPQTTPPVGNKVACGKTVDSKEYIKLHGTP